LARNAASARKIGRRVVGGVSDAQVRSGETAAWSDVEKGADVRGVGDVSMAIASAGSTPGCRSGFAESSRDRPARVDFAKNQDLWRRATDGDPFRSE
jgi:hypothetical protein